MLILFFYETSFNSHLCFYYFFPFYGWVSRFIYTSIQIYIFYILFHPENRSGFDNSPNDELKLKSTGSSYCLMRHNRSVNQLRERGSSGATSSTYNFSINCDNTMQNKSTESTMLTSTTALSNRKQTVMEGFFIYSRVLGLNSCVVP